MEAAHFTPPSTKQIASFTNRTAALAKRVMARADPSTLLATFPAPRHPLFPEQIATNTEVVSALADEARSTIELVKKAEASAKAYQERVESIQRVETLRNAAEDLNISFAALLEKLRQGIATSEGDGSPPDLSTEECLREDRHVAFLTLLPSICGEIDQANVASQAVLRDSRPALLRIDRPGIDPQLTSRATAQFQQLSVLTEEVTAARANVLQCAERLRAARKLWGTMVESLAELQNIHAAVSDAMDQQRWRRQSLSYSNIPITPESPGPTSLTATITPATASSRLSDASSGKARTIDPMMVSLVSHLNGSLKAFLTQSGDNLTGHCQNLTRLIGIWGAIQDQSSAMADVRSATHVLQIQGEDIKLRYDNAIRDVLESESSDTNEVALEDNLVTATKSFQGAVEDFTNSLASKVKFVTQGESVADFLTSAKPTPSSLSSQCDLDILRRRPSLHLPFDLTAVDASVRADSNSYAMALAGDVQALKRKQEHLRLARTAKELDRSMVAILKDVQSVEDALKKFRASLMNPSDDLLLHLATLNTGVDTLLHADRSRIARSFSPVRDTLRRINHSSESDAEIRHSLLTTRQRALDDVELRFNAWIEGVAALKKQLADIESAELRRLEEEKLAAEKRKRAEEERLAAEELARLHREKQEAEERERKEQEERERLETEEREKLRREEQERLEAEAREKRAREEQEQMEKEERERKEQEERGKLEKEERERLKREEQERSEKEERERWEKQERERKEKEDLQRREREEQERLEKAERERKEREECERREREERELLEKVERERKERQESEQREREERERLEKVERERKEREEGERREKAEREKLAREEAERKEKERLEMKQRMEQERTELERAEKEERERQEREREEREKQDREQRERLEKEREQRLEQEKQERGEMERRQKEERMRLDQEQKKAEKEQNLRLEHERRAEEDRLRHEAEERARLGQESLRRAEEMARLELGNFGRQQLSEDNQEALPEGEGKPKHQESQKTGNGSLEHLPEGLNSSPTERPESNGLHLSTGQPVEGSCSPFLTVKPMLTRRRRIRSSYRGNETHSECGDDRTTETYRRAQKTPAVGYRQRTGRIEVFHSSCVTNRRTSIQSGLKIGRHRQRCSTTPCCR
jgi:hypothetical protein